MTEPSAGVFFQACGAAGPLRLAVERPGGTEASPHEFGRPFALVGRERWADLTLGDPAVSQRHAYLQMIGGRVFCVDLGSRTGVRAGGQPVRAGWLAADRPAGIGPFEVRPLSADPLGPDIDPDPLAARSPDDDPLPAVSLEVLAGRRRLVWRMNRVLALVGQATGCKVRVADRGVGLYHCGLVRTPVGLWVVDLLGSGTAVNRTPVRFAWLGHEDELLVGDTLLRVRYRPAPGPVSPVAVRAEAVGPSEADSLRTELAVARADAETLQGRLCESERSAESVRTELDAVRSAAVAEVDAARAEAEGLRTDLAAARNEIDRLSDTTVMDGLRREIDSLQGQLAAAQAGASAEAEAFRNQVIDLQKSAAEAGVAVDRLRADQEAARAVWERERADRLAEVERAAADAESLRAELEAVRQELDQTGLTVDRLRREIDVLRAERGQAEERAEAALAALGSARADVTAVGERGRAELDAARASAAAAVAEADSLRQRTADLDRLLAEAATVREALLRERAEEQARWEAERRTAAESVTASQAEVARERETIRAELEAAKAGLAERQAHVAEADGVRAELVAARGQLDRERAAREMEVGQLRRVAASLRQEQDRLTQQVKALTDELERPVPHGIDLTPRPAAVAGPPRQTSNRAARPANQQWVSFPVRPVQLPPDNGGPAQG